MKMTEMEWASFLFDIKSMDIGDSVVLHAEDVKRFRAWGYRQGWLTRGARDGAMSVRVWRIA